MMKYYLCLYFLFMRMYVLVERGEKMIITVFIFIDKIYIFISVCVYI